MTQRHRYPKAQGEFTLTILTKVLTLNRASTLFSQKCSTATVYRISGENEQPTTTVKMRDDNERRTGGFADRATALVVVWRLRGHRGTHLWLGTAGDIRARSHTDQPPALPDHVWSWVVHDEVQGQIGLGDNG
jgi:hypothetical protein